MMGNGVLLNLDHLCAEQDAGVWMQRALDVVEQALDAWVPADAPSGLTHTLVNGVPIRLDGEPVASAIDARPGRLLRSGR